MPTEDNNTLKYNHGEKSLKAPWVIYTDFECLQIKQQSCQNSSEESYTGNLILFTNLVVILYIQLVHLIQNKTNIVLIEEKTVLTNFVKI